MNTTSKKATSSQGLHAGRGLCRRLAAPLLALAQSLFACEQTDDAPRGQSGSEARAGAGPVTQDVDLCPCDALGVYLRVTVLQKEGASLSLRVEAVIHGATPLTHGAELRADWNGELPCSGSQTNIGIGTEALVVFTPAERAGGSCDAAPCENGDWTRGDVRLTPWADQLLMAQTAEASLSVPASELARLWSNQGACLARYGDWSTLPGAFEDGVVP
jgi:hypothetical protein